MLNSAHHSPCPEAPSSAEMVSPRDLSNVVERYEPPPRTAPAAAATFVE